MRKIVTQYFVIEDIAFIGKGPNRSTCTFLAGEILVASTNQTPAMATEDTTVLIHHEASATEFDINFRDFGTLLIEYKIVQTKHPNERSNITVKSVEECLHFETTVDAYIPEFEIVGGGWSLSVRTTDHHAKKGTPVAISILIEWGTHVHFNFIDHTDTNVRFVCAPDHLGRLVASGTLLQL